MPEGWDTLQCNGSYGEQHHLNKNKSTKLDSYWSTFAMVRVRNTASLVDSMPIRATNRRHD
jgi:hypothetical protein